MGNHWQPNLSSRLLPVGITEKTIRSLHEEIHQPLAGEGEKGTLAPGENGIQTNPETKGEVSRL